MKVSKGDTVTFLGEGEVTIKRKGAKPMIEAVGAGEVVTMHEAAEIEGVPAIVDRAKLSRVLFRRSARQQHVRHATEPLTTFEFPDVVDSEQKRIELALEERGAALKRRLLLEVDRFKSR